MVAVQAGVWWQLEKQDLDPVNEKRMIRGLKRGDEAAFNTLVKLHQGRVFNVCYRMLGNGAEAEDIAQDVFVRAFQAVHAFRGDSAIGTWLYRIAVNLCKNRLKYLSRRHYNKTSVLEDVPERAYASAGSQRTVGDPEPRPDQVLEGLQAESRIQKALAAVDSSFRELLVLRDIQNLSYAEVMTITGLAEGTVKSRLHRARAALRKAYNALEAGS